MEGETSWSDDEFDDNRKGTGVFHPHSGLTDEIDGERNLISVDSTLVPKDSFKLNMEGETSWFDDENRKGTGIFHPHQGLTDEVNDERTLISIDSILVSENSFKLNMDGETSWSGDEFDDNRERTGVFHPSLGLTDKVEDEINLISIDSIIPSENSCKLDMEGETSWSDDEFDDNRKGSGVFHPSLGLTDEVDDERNLISIDSILLDELQERILASLPLEYILKACCVCKRWNEMVHSKRFMSSISNVLSHEPWYFMFTSCDEPVGYIYDPMLRKWYGSELPCTVKSNCYTASSCGLVCIMDAENGSELYVCNPLTRKYKKLEEPLGQQFFGYSAIAFAANGSLHSYTVTIVRSERVLDHDDWDVSIHVYYSQTMRWLSPVTKSVAGWRGGYDSVICDGVLYFLVYCTRVDETDRHGLLTYNLQSSSSNDMSIDNRIRIPFCLTCGRLMNLNDKLVMVGGIGKPNRPGIIKGIGIWVLKGSEFEEVSRIPHKFFQGFGELDDVFASSGAGNLIYIQSYGETALLVFDMNSKQWNWSQKCPVIKKFPLQLFSGFCFEPQLEISS